MKLKLMTLSALFAAGVFASFALADGGHHSQKADGCHKVHILGTIAPQTLAVTVDKANEKSLIPAGTVLSLALGATGQTVRVAVEACATGTDGALAYSVRGLELRVKPTRTATTQAATTETSTTAPTQHGDREHGKRDRHHTTTTTAATTTTGTTTTTP